ncbi:uncharacterized protein PFL1_04242 [Pseudozyma flocculosa PF-1]|uniref:Arabinogalactan endo-beta-1,4-galactanase n=2 Tax=Pseudozyma flocculosa TaxID=84751 RepID=A0A5C3EWQ3_9BASI|nr:uncharacterized protein PFL1_04242 [Pseudozyma flocculosa PF-1]EPQ28415.1 hypothetical protein PFL1_04242 [Pseudozyma flocculosa PF-1]SPO35579.1 related to arabinogalactan endo-1,4-beta-galactosidase [Pseudozyma flocculosa]
MLRHLYLLPLFVSAAAAALTYKGVDWSSTSLLESQGTKWYTSSGSPAALETIMAQNGVNTVRQRIWVNPSGGVYGLDYNVALARRAQKAGLKVYLDFHYSDTWADPAHQVPPAKWKGQGIDDLSNTLYQYTLQSMQAFKSAGIDVEMVSIGNEIRNGLLAPVGALDPSTNDVAWNTARLLHSASAGVRDAKLPRRPKIMIHIDNGWDASLQTKWYEKVLKANSLLATDYDIQGVSYYPFYDSRATLANLASGIRTLKSKYAKEVMVVETDWPSKCSSPKYPFPSDTKNIPFTTAGQAQWIQTVAKTAQQAGADGLFYWEPFWKSNANLGSSCEDNTFIDAQGRVTTALAAFKSI